jgi:hypothetical protein
VDLPEGFLVVALAELTGVLNQKYLDGDLMGRAFDEEVDGLTKLA